MKKGYIDINVVLDRSGSMSSIASDTIGGYNSFLKSQKGLEGTATFTLAQFDDQYEVVYSGVNVEEVSDLDNNTFRPRGWTALYDAICRTINETGSRLAKLDESERPEKVLFVIITDGAENRSSEFKADDVQRMIEHQKDKYSWEFIFIGANQDAIATARRIGISYGNALNYAANTKGTQSLYSSVSQMVGSSRLEGLSSANFEFRKEDRKAQDEAAKN